MTGDEQIVCPTCGRGHPPTERFCERCGMPLVHPVETEQSVDRRQQLARKIKPQYTEGPLVKVGQAVDQPQADFMAGLLLEEGIPCIQRTSIGGYGPMLGARDILVPASGAEAAREALKYERPA